MSEIEKYPYETRLNVLYDQLEVVDEKAISDACEHKWFNQTLCRVNESVVRLGVVGGGSLLNCKGGRWNWGRDRGSWCRRL